ncbi:MAG: TRAP transporter small permease [Pikeienuella sp.]
MQDLPDEGGAAADIHIEDEEIDLSDLNWGDGIILVAFWILAFDVFLQFFTRYVLNNSLGWTEEIARYLLICVTFTGAVMAVRKRSHIAVEFLYRWMPRPGRRVAQALIDLVSIAFYAGMTWLTAELASKTRQAMVSIQIPKAWLYWLVAACFAAMTLYAIRVGWRHLVTGTSPLIDPDAHADSAHMMD